MKKINDLEKEINLIKKRNRRVEADKAWETGWFRKITIAVLTYAVIVLFFITAGFSKPFINAHRAYSRFFTLHPINLRPKRILDKKYL